MDTPQVKNFRIGPTTQQGGTQTIQQSIYIAHDNPCGANKLIFQELGLTKIRYIDLKNYLDTILNSEQMVELFKQVVITGTEYMNDPFDELKFPRYIYTIQQWAQAGLANLPVDVLYYPGYRFKLSVFDASGCAIYDSNWPTIKPVYVDVNDGNKYFTTLTMVDNPAFLPVWTLYKICNNTMLLPYIKIFDVPSGPPYPYPYAFILMFSEFIVNQSIYPETSMAVGSLLVDSANTRSFGIPKYGFSAREGQTALGGLTYNCCHIFNINTTSDENGKVTLIESIFVRLSLEQVIFG